MNLGRIQFLMLTAGGTLALLLAIGLVVLTWTNRQLQGELNQRQQFVQQGVALEGLYRDMVKTLAELAIKSNDHQVLDMLAAQGLSINVSTPAAPAASAPATPPAQGHPAK